jgi:hypothetical protein
MEGDQIPAPARRFLDACALRATAAAEQALAPFIVQPAHLLIEIIPPAGFMK